MWKALRDVTTAIGKVRTLLVKVHNRIDQAGHNAPAEAAAAQEAVEEVEQEIAKAVSAIQEIYERFRMHEYWPSRSGSVYRVQAGNNGTPAPPPAQEHGRDERSGESSPNVSPVPRDAPLDSRSGGNERRAPDPEDSGCAKVDGVSPLQRVSFDFGRDASDA